jgi:hypothetical protein
MKKIIIILTVLPFFFIGCTTLKKLNGKYSDGKHIEFVFTDTPNKFEYYLRSEMGVLEYSTGSWVQNKNQVILNGFTGSNINSLSYENTTTKNTDSKDKVLIRYTPASNLEKTDVIINDSNVIHVSMDTTFFSAIKIKTIQVKSYLSYTGLLSSPPKIDTLYSSKIKVNDGSSENKNIVLTFTVHPYDFTRVKFNDTLIVKSNRILYLNKTKLKK